MPRRRLRGNGRAAGAAPHVALEQRLVLLAWLNDLFGYRSNREMLGDLRDTAEGFDATGRGHLWHHLAARGDQVKVPRTDLARYDENVRGHLRALNARRPEPITLRYFQHAALLHTELFLDWYFHRRGEMVRSLNAFARRRDASRGPGAPRPGDAGFAESDLGKLAFWMATGSGKTLIMHVNYRQFLHYNRTPLDNVLLITPNEGLSEQHLAEMTASGIPCRSFGADVTGLAAAGGHTVSVIEITKLAPEKRGGGVSVPVEAFDGDNLIFVDEGHKGSGGAAWRSFRDALGETGFTFEYSATFGQALSAARNDELTSEYGKSIVFDYSYRYFHGDGYGKDFRVLNLKEEAAEEQTDALLLGNLLSFYEQQRVFRERADALRPYHLERPLWVFVGGTVNAVHTRGGRKRSDVLTVVRFLHRVLENRQGWVVRTIAALLAGRTGLVTSDGRDAFADRFEFLRETRSSPEDVYRDLLAVVLHAPAGGGLHLCVIRGSAGEIGLKASGADDYFGLIYIGDTAAFRKLAEEDGSGMALEEDVVSGSLFDAVGRPATTVDVLIGAKKFMEGWNSWRVSSMGLLNIGRKEGSEIIQLFGRGVRLRGKGFSLKRSAATGGRHPAHLGLLETLDVFAVRADYMAQFRAYLEREGIEIEGDAVELPLGVRTNEDFLSQGLVVHRVPEDRNFVDEENLVLEPDRNIRARVDLSLKAQSLSSGAGGLTAIAMRGGHDAPIPASSLDLVDWQRVYLELLEYKERKEYDNLVIRPEAARKIVETSDPDRLYSLIADDAIVAPETFAGTELLHEAVLSVLRSYVDRFYRARRERWESERMVYTELDQDDENFRDYKVMIPRGEVALIDAIQKLIEQADHIYRAETRELPSVHFDRHLYQPLLVERGDRVKSDPPGLNEAERRFVEDLRRYCRSERNGSLAGKEIYLLRNLSRGKGVGFFGKRGFYPDFILWVKDGAAQRIIFIEPHGMLHAEAYMHDDKARLHEVLPGLAASMASRTMLKDVTLDSFIVSATPYEELRARYGDGTWNKELFGARHILFRERTDTYDYVARMIAPPAGGSR